MTAMNFETSKEIKGLFRIGGAAAALQLVAILVYAIRPALTKLWPFTLALGSLSFLIGLYIAITGYVPGVTDDESILAVCWAFIFGGGLGLYLLTFVAGFAHDIEQIVAG